MLPLAADHGPDSPVEPSESSGWDLTELQTNSTASEAYPSASMCATTVRPDSALARTRPALRSSGADPLPEENRGKLLWFVLTRIGRACDNLRTVKPRRT